ncbi:MAG: ABC transporter permease subunit [Candidatus Puniceispirillaceae bacterium]
MKPNTPRRLYYVSSHRFVMGLIGVFGLIGLGVACLVTLASVGFDARSFENLLSSRYFRHVITITLIQSSLSVLCASFIGVCGALAFFRRDAFWGRKWFLTGCFSAMIMPTTVAALALLKLWGQSGLLAQTPLAAWLPDRLGLWMVIVAHSFFNAPLVMRVCLSSLEAIPQSQKRQAALLRLSPLRYFQIIDWPAIITVLPSVMGLVFLLCFTSFSLVLMLGGGPSVTTLEVSIYTALRFEFNLPKAALLSFIQLCACLLILGFFTNHRATHTSLQRPYHQPVTRFDTSLFMMKFCDGFIIFGLFILNILPIILLLAYSDVFSGLALFGKMRFWLALYHSLGLAIGSAILALTLAFILGYFRHEITLRGSNVLAQLIEVSHSLFLIIPALVLGTALFISLRAFVDVTSYGFWILLLGNGLLALPFCYRIITPSLQRHLTETDRLCALLHLSSMKRFWFITLPSLRHEMGFALGLSAALSFGDLGIITLFGSQSFETLPYLLFQFLNRYGADEADLLALILLTIAICLYGGFSKLVVSLGNFLTR